MAFSFLYQQAVMAFDDHIRPSLVLTSVGFVEKNITWQKEKFERKK